MGSHQTIKVDVRVIAATSMPLEVVVKEKLFRSDLYFRLNVIPVQLPPLRHRKGDIPLLTDFFIEKFCRAMNKKVKGITPEAREVLEAYPGRVMSGNWRTSSNGWWYWGLLMSGSRKATFRLIF